MPNSVHAARRPGRHANSALSRPNNSEVADSNLTTSHFLGTQQRAWMKEKDTGRPASPERLRQMATTNDLLHNQPLTTSTLPSHINIDTNSAQVISATTTRGPSDEFVSLSDIPPPPPQDRVPDQDIQHATPAQEHAGLQATKFANQRNDHSPPSPQAIMQDIGDISDIIDLTASQPDGSSSGMSSSNHNIQNTSIEAINPPLQKDSGGVSSHPNNIISQAQTRTDQHASALLLADTELAPTKVTPSDGLRHHRIVTPEIVSDSINQQQPSSTTESESARISNVLDNVPLNQSCSGPVARFRDDSFSSSPSFVTNIHGLPASQRVQAERNTLRLEISTTSPAQPHPNSDFTDAMQIGQSHFQPVAFRPLGESSMEQREPLRSGPSVIATNPQSANNISTHAAHFSQAASHRTAITPQTSQTTQAHHGLEAATSPAILNNRLPSQPTTSAAHQPLVPQGHMAFGPNQSLANSSLLGDQSPNTELLRSSLPDLTTPYGLAQRFLGYLENAINHMPGRIALSETAQLRISWLKDACHRHDLLFLLLNQLFCIWGFQKSVLETLGLGVDCDNGFKVLDLLFGYNQEMPREFVAFLARWPYTTHSLQATTELRQWVQVIAKFLPHLGAHWDRFRQACLTRKYPPSAAEIADYTHCPRTVILPRAMYRSIERQLNPSSTPKFQVAAFDLFVRDQTRYLSMSLQREDLGATQSESMRFAQAYLNLAVNAARNIATTPRLDSSAGSLFAAGYPRNLQGQFDGPRQVQNMPEPNTRVYQPIGATTSLSLENFRRLSDSGPVVSPLSSANMSHRRATDGQANPTQVAQGSTFFSTTDRLLPDLRSLPPLLSNPVPEQEALHQSHLRPPKILVKDLDIGSATRLFQFIQAFALEPYLWSSVTPFFSVIFHLSPDLEEKKAHIIPSSEDSFANSTRIVSNESILFNLRCALVNPPIKEAEWAALPTHYPQHIFISLNGHHLEIRRRRQHGRDLPIDVTPFVKGGQNNVQVSMHMDKESQYKQFGIAIEVIALKDIEQVRRMPKEIPSEVSLNQIRSAMRDANDQEEDDEIQIVNDSIVLAMTDPFSSTMVTTPVRGQTCNHRECFDLETYLESRISDYRDASTSVYQWRCPFCGKDARPRSLIIDGFLSSVRETLIGAGHENARAIVVKRDGTWVLKQAIDQKAAVDSGAHKGSSDGLGSDSCKEADQVSTFANHTPVRPASGDSRNNSADILRPARSKTVEIIDLDD